jgi:hypothetical protein
MNGRAIRRVGTAGLVVLIMAACEQPTTFANDAPRALVVASVMTGMSGAGAIGSGSPTFYGLDRQAFVIDVGLAATGPYGKFDYVDSGFVKEDGDYPHFVVGPEWAGTRIVSFAPTSGECAEFAGVGRLLNTDELLAFRVMTCDYGTPGTDLDVFGIEVPQRLLTHGDIYSEGPLALARGNLTHAGIRLPTFLPARDAR